MKKALSIIIKEVLPVALRYGNSKFGNNWTFQQDNGTPHTHQETQEWCSQHFPSFVDKDTWPANTPELNPDIEKFTNCEIQAWCEKNSLGSCKEKLFRLDESFVSHDTKRWKLFKRIKSSLSDRESKDESF